MPDRKKSPARKGKDTSREEASADVNIKPQLASNEGSKHMANEQPSIVEFSEEIATAEAPTPLPVSDYPAEIRGAQRKTSNAGNDYARVTFYIDPQAYPADVANELPEEGITLDYNRVSLADTPAGRHRVRKFCEAIGAPMKGRTVDLNDWVGRTATVSIQHGQWEGETRAEIAKVVAP